VSREVGRVEVGKQGVSAEGCISREIKREREGKEAVVRRE